MCGTQPLASPTAFTRSQILPPSEMKSLYGSITRSAVICLSKAGVSMLPPVRTYGRRPAESVTAAIIIAGGHHARCSWREQGLLSPTATQPHISQYRESSLQDLRHDERIPTAAGQGA